MIGELIDYKSYEDDFIHALLSINPKKARHILKELAKKDSLVNIIDNFIAPVFNRIGRDWEKGTLALSQLYLSSHICDSILNEMMVAEEPSGKEQPNIGIATLGDFHRIGMKMITYALNVEGYKVVDFGYGLLIHDIVEKCLKNETNILLLSAHLLSTALLVKQLIEALREAGLDVKVIVGGSPFYRNKKLWREVGAYAIGNNASDAVGIVKRLEKEMSDKSMMMRKTA